MIKYILASFIALMIVAGFSYDEPVESAPVEVKKAIKLTTKNLPINRYFSDDEDGDQQVAPRSFLFRRDTSIKAKTDIAPAEDDYVISDGIKLRLMLARIRALEKFDQIHGIDKI